MKTMKIKTLLLTALFAAIISIGFASCSGDNNIVDTSLKITDVVLPTSIDVIKGGEVTITGKGFQAGDVIVFTAQDGTTYSATVTSATANSVTFNLPAGVSTGKYAARVVRGTTSASLTNVNVNIIANLNIPDVAGKNVKGVVYCNGDGVPNVVVSDGFEVTTTDANGVYYLNSEKKNGYVFISLPSGYEVTTLNSVPQFYQYLKENQTTVEQKDFSLTKVDNTDYTLLVFTDVHLANRNNDLSQFQAGFFNEVNELAVSTQVQSKKIYGLTLGDLAWDAYWYSNSYALPDYIQSIKGIGCPVFNTMGNHDNDPYCADDWLAEQAWKTTMGPSYYSFNLGDIHYVVLDNVMYINNGGAIGNVGDRNYNNVVIADQIEWLKKDLAYVTDKTKPVFVAMHVPANKVQLSGQNVVRSGNYTSNRAEIEGCFAGFSDVQFLTGHTHINYSLEYDQFFEHNIAGVCATWWWTGKNGYSGNHICCDGSIGGYEVFDIKGTNLEWYYKCIGYPKTKQFRTYDRNQIQITAAKYITNTNVSDADKAVFESSYSGEYVAPSTDNYVLINVYNFDTGWNIKVTENGTELPVTRIQKKDPLHIISYPAKRYNVANSTPSFNTTNTTHMFQVQATSATSTLEITVTDRFGNVYTETMTRPKALTTDMQ